MTETEAELLVSSLERGLDGIEAFLKLPADDRTTIMTQLEKRVGDAEIRRILEQCEADGTMDQIRTFLEQNQRQRGSAA